MKRLTALLLCLTLCLGGVSLLASCNPADDPAEGSTTTEPGDGTTTTEPTDDGTTTAEPDDGTTTTEPDDGTTTAEPDEGTTTGGDHDCTTTAEPDDGTTTTEPDSDTTTEPDSDTTTEPDSDTTTEPDNDTTTEPETTPTEPFIVSMYDCTEHARGEECTLVGCTAVKLNGTEVTPTKGNDRIDYIAMSGLVIGDEIVIEGITGIPAGAYKIELVAKTSTSGTRATVKAALDGVSFNPQVNMNVVTAAVDIDSEIQGHGWSAANNQYAWTLTNCFEVTTSSTASHTLKVSVVASGTKGTFEFYGLRFTPVDPENPLPEPTDTLPEPDGTEPFIVPMYSCVLHARDEACQMIGCTALKVNGEEITPPQGSDRVHYFAVQSLKAGDEIVIEGIKGIPAGTYRIEIVGRPHSSGARVTVKAAFDGVAFDPEINMNDKQGSVIVDSKIVGHGWAAANNQYAWTFADQYEVTASSAESHTLKVTVVAAGTGASSFEFYGLRFVPVNAAKSATELDLGCEIHDSRFEIIRTANTQYSITEFSTVEEVEQRREELKYNLRVAAGLYPWPEKNDMEIIIEDVGTFDGYKIQKIMYETYPGFWSLGNLYLPDPMPEGKVPAILTIPGHGGRLLRETGLDGRDYPTMDANLAKMGFIVLVTDNVGYADSRQVSHNYGRGDADGKHATELWLSNGLGIQLWNNIRALDVLCSMPEVDAENIGVTGNSGGGDQTLFLALLDDRVKAIAPVGQLSLHNQGGCKCENPALLRRYTDNIEMCAMLAPRPLFMAGSTGDWTKDLLTKDVPAVLEAYELYGDDAVAQFEYFYQEAGHNYNIYAREKMYNFFARHLMGEDIEWTEQTITYEQDVLTFTWYQNQGKAPGFATSEEYFAAHKLELAERISTLSDDEKLKMLAWMTDVRENSPDVTVVSSEEKDGITIEKILLRGDYGEELPVVKMIPANANGKVCLVLSGDGKDCLLQEKYRSLLDEGITLVSGDLFQTGETAHYEQIQILNGIVQPDAIHIFHTTYNNMPDALRVQDVCLLAAMAAELGDELTIRAEGSAARAVACALPLLDCVQTAYLEQAALDVLDLTDDSTYFEYFYIPGICALGGLPACLDLATCAVQFE